MKFYSANKYLLSICLVMWVYSCRNPTYQLFYADKENMYFIHPLKFKGERNHVKADFTFRDNLESEQLVKCNISLFQKNPLKITSIQLINQTDSIDLAEVEKIFIEKQGKLFEIRYGGQVPFESFSSLVKSGSFSIVLNQENQFTPSSRTSKRIAEIQHDVMQVIYLN